MKLWDNIKRAFKALPPFSQSSTGGGWMVLNDANWRNLYAGTSIDYRTAVGDLTQSSLMMAAVNWFATALPEAPIQVLKRTSPKVLDPIPDHPLVQLINNPNDYDTGEELWAGLALSWLIDGNAYWLKERNSFGQVIQLWYEPHFSIRARWPEDGSEFISYYEVLRNGKWYRVGGPQGDASDVVHFRNGKDPYNSRYGLSPVASILREIYTDNERANYAALLMKNCGRFSVVVSPKETAADVDTDAIKVEIIRRSTGDESFKPIVLTGPVELNKLALSPDEMAIEVLSRAPEWRMAAATRIPAVILQYEAGWAHATYSNIQDAREDAYEGMLIPNQRRIAAQLRRQLLPDFEPDTQSGKLRPDPDFEIAFDLSQVRVLQEDRDALFKREVAAFVGGIKTRAEAKSALGLETTPEDEVYRYPPGTLLVKPDELPQEATAALKPAPVAIDPNTPPPKLNGAASAKDERELERR